MKMPFGKFQGTRLEKIPRPYLQWLVNNLDDRYSNIKREARRILEPQAKATKAKPCFEKERYENEINDLLNEIMELKLNLEDERRLRHAAESKPKFGGDWFDAWYMKIARISHPDIGGDERVMKLVNDLKDRIEGR